MLQTILDQFHATDPMNGFGKAALVKQFCMEARNQLVQAVATKPELLGDDTFQLVIDALDPQSPVYGIGTDMGRAVRLFKRGVELFS
jgi:hypothetical protein